MWPFQTSSNDRRGTLSSSKRPPTRRRVAVESLEGRELLTTGSVVLSPFSLAHPAATARPVAAVTGASMPNVTQPLVQLYQAFKANPTSGDALATQFPYLTITGNSVRVQIRASGNFTSFVASLKALGMQVNTASAAYNLVDGDLPIAQIPTVAALPQTLSMGPVFKPLTQTAHRPTVPTLVHTPIFAPPKAAPVMVTTAGLFRRR